MTERGLRMNVSPVDDYVGDDIRNYITRKECFDFCSEAFGEMRHSTEEEKMLYENMLDMLSDNTSLFEREILGKWVYNPDCEDCTLPIREDSSANSRNLTIW